MSTKTSIKRIAAVAAVALTLGGFSAVSAHATATAVTPSTTASSTSITAVTGTYQAFTVTGNSSDAYYTITTDAGGQVYYPSSTSLDASTLSANGSTQIWSNGLGAIGATTGSWTNSLTFTASAAAAGTQTITVKGNVNTGAQTFVITWGASPVVSTTNSKVYLADKTSGETVTTVATAIAATIPTADSPVVASKSTASTTVVGAVFVKLYDNSAAGGAALKAKKVTATITGSGLVDGYKMTSSPTLDTNFNGTPAKSADAYTSSASTKEGYAVFHVMSDGTAGTGTIAITYTDSLGVVTTLATKTVTFFSTTPAKIVATQNNFVGNTTSLTLGAADAGAGDGAITVVATDANGNPVSGLTAGTSSSLGFYLTSDNTACFTSTIGSVVEGDGVGLLDNPIGTYEINVNVASGAAAGCKANVTVSYYISTTSAAVSAAPLAFTVAGTKIYSLALATDADSYAPGDKVTYTLTAKDSAGNLIADGQYGIFAAPAHPVTTAIAGLTMTASLVKTPFAVAAAASGSTYNDVTFVNGVATSSTYAPYYSGSVKGSVTLPLTDSSLATALLGTTVSATFAVSNPGDAASQAAIDAAQEATDAANAAYDAANNAMDSADAATAAAQDAADNASAALAAVTSLSATVAKLVKSVAAIAAALAKVQKKIGA